MKLKILILQISIIFIWLSVITNQNLYAQAPIPSQSIAAVYFASKPFTGKGAQGAEKSPKFKAGGDIYCRVIFNQPLNKIFKDDDDAQKVVIFYLYQISDKAGMRPFEASLRMKITPDLVNQNYLDVDLMPAPDKALTNESRRLSEILAGDRYPSTNMEERKQVGQIKRFSLNVGVGKENTRKAGEGELQIDYTSATVKLLKDWYERDKIAYETIKSKTEKGDVFKAIALVKKLPLPAVFLTPYATGAGTISYKDVTNEQIISLLEQRYESKIYLFRFIKPQAPEDYSSSYLDGRIVGKTGNKYFFYIYKDKETGACKASPGTLYRKSEGNGNFGELSIEDFFLDVEKYIENAYPKDKNNRYYVDCDKLK